MKNFKITIIPFLTLFMMLTPLMLFAQNCLNNGGFELNSFANWSGKSGKTKTGITKGHCAINKIKGGGGISNSVHQIVGIGFDPMVGNNILPTVVEGNFSAKLGNETPNNKAQSLTYEFTVQSPKLYFNYAFVLQDPPDSHTKCQRPYFYYKIKIPGFKKNIKEKIVSDDPGFYKSGSLLYKPWGCDFVDLSNYIGKKVKIEFIVADCAKRNGTHFGYAYIDGLCTEPIDNLNPSFALSKVDYCLSEAIFADGSDSENETHYFWSVEESDAQMGRPNPGSEKILEFVGQASSIDLKNFYEKLGGVFICNQYYRVKLAVKNGCIEWNETVQLIKINCPEADAGKDVCCIKSGDSFEIGNSISNDQYTYSWSPQTGLLTPTSSSTILNCESFIDIDIGSLLKYPILKGDFDGDEKTDIAFVGQDWSGPSTGLHILTLFSNGDGTYDFKEFVAGDGPGVHTYPALTGDFNGDDKTDIAFIGQNWSNPETGLHIRTRFSNGDGTYDFKEFVAGDGNHVHTYPALTGYFNGDDKTDIAFIGQNWSNPETGLHIRTRFSNGDGTYDFKEFVAGDGLGVHTYPALTGDFNGDDKTDIAFIGQNWSNPETGLHIRTRFSNGDGTYDFKEFVAGDGNHVHTYPALTGYFNGDDKTDIAFIGQNWSNPETGLHIRTRFSNGDGTYDFKEFVAGDGLGVHTYPALTGDFNGDDKTDIAFIGQNWSNPETGLHIRTRFSNGDGTYDFKEFVAGDGNNVHTYPALTGYFNGDDKTDIAFVGQNWNDQFSGLHVRTRFSNGDGTYSFKQFSIGGESTTYTLTVTDHLGCISQDQVEVGICRPPNGQISISRESLCSTNALIKVNLDDNSCDSPSITWQPLGLSSTNITVNSLNYSNLSLVLKNGCGEKIKSFSIPSFNKLEGNFPPLKCPNVITPNGDGYNDFFRVLDNTLPPNSSLSYNATKYKFSVYNRWGKLLFEGSENAILSGFSNNSIPNWDGKRNDGTILSDGVYFYVFQLENCTNSLSSVCAGTVHILH